MSTPGIAEARPSYVRFERRGVEDRNKSLAMGHYCERDVDFAIVTPQGSKDVFEQQADEWFAMLRTEVRSGRLPQKWFDAYQNAYEHFKRGEEPPLDGTPVKNWSIPSPSQIKALINARLLTIEDVAAANDEAIRAVGMGAVALRQAAKDYIAQAKNSGKAILELQKLRTERDEFKRQAEAANEKVQLLNLEIIQLRAIVGQAPAQQSRPATDPSDSIMEGVLEN